MLPNYSKSEQSPEELYSVEMEERLETINLPIGEIVDNCCTRIFDPCLSVDCDCKENPDSYLQP
jgi:hypothetical protein